MKRESELKFQLLGRNFPRGGVKFSLGYFLIDSNSEGNTVSHCVIIDHHTGFLQR